MPPRRRQIHGAWIVLGAVVFVVFCTSGLRGSFGVFIKPLEAEFGWTRSVLSGVARCRCSCGARPGRWLDIWPIAGDRDG